MEQIVLRLPTMWADHHVLAVRRALQSLGIQEIEASAARQAVRLRYDPSALKREEILRTLSEAGYDPTRVMDCPLPYYNKEHRAAWITQGLRMTQTNRLDLEMSGDFRKY